jgi:glycosyltransferase involved in cell wall biosynthesis
MYISIVVPLLNEKDSLQELTDGVTKQLAILEKESEILFIDDGSTDGSFEKLIELKKAYQNIKIIRLRRNFGKSAALFEGFQRAKGKYVITMDADLQDDPAEIPNLISELKNGYDLVSGWKKKRHDPITKTMPSKFFNGTTRFLTGIKIHDFNCGLKGYRSEVIKSIPVYGEFHRYLPVLAHWQGFRVGEIEVVHHPRKHGKTKFGVRRFFSGFFDLLTVLFLTRYRQKPMHLFGFLGLACFLIGFIILTYLSLLWFSGHPIGNRPLLSLGILMVIVGVQSFSLGLIGDMVTNTQQQVNESAVREEFD